MSGEIDLGLRRRLAATVGYDAAGLWGVTPTPSALRFATPALLQAASPDVLAIVPVGDWIEAGSFWYQRAENDAIDHHVTTASGIRLYVRPMGQPWSPLAFFAPTDGSVDAGGTTTGSDASAAFQACFDAASAAAVVAVASAGVYQSIRLPLGVYLVNGLTLNSSRIRVDAHGCELRSYAAQASVQFMLTIAGAGFDEGQLLTRGGITGLVLEGRRHANVYGLHLRGAAHFHFYQASIRSFAGHGLLLENAYDVTFWGGFITFCGVTGTSLTDAVEALSMLSTTIDNCNQIYFYTYTFESNYGVDVAIRQPAGGSTYYNNAISFVGCKWEQSGSNTVWCGVYIPGGFQNSLSFEGKCYIAGYHRDGCWLDGTISTSGKVTISPSTDFGYKSDQAAGGSTLPTIILRGNGGALIGGRLAATRASLVPFLDLQNVTDPVQIEFSDVSTAYDYVDGWTLVMPGNVSQRCDVDGGRLRYVFKLAGSDSGTTPNQAVSFVPRGKSGICDVLVADTPTAVGSAGFRIKRGASEIGGAISASAAAIGSPAALEFGTGDLTSGGTGTTADKIHIRFSTATDGLAWVQNRMTGTRRVFVSVQPARWF